MSVLEEIVSLRKERVEHLRPVVQDRWLLSTILLPEETRVQPSHWLPDEDATGLLDIVLSKPLDYFDVTGLVGDSPTWKV